VNTLISPDARAAPANACLAGIPTTIIGGPISIVRATVQPASLQPDPFFRSKTLAAVR
jgi:hypothetical protein